ncbi:MAG: hypothetical protein EOM54_07935 [Clostridia bacterium]|nr:hypothetical protein [Clostridia bacterium]
MDKQIMYAAILFVAGWFYFYICLRQLIFDFIVAYPLIKKFGDAGVMASVGAKRLNSISVAIWLLICVGIAFVVIRYCALYLLISFFVGAAIGLVVFLNKLGPKTPSNFEAFIHTYCRFVEDDELRGAMTSADLPKIRAALRTLGVDMKIDLKN